MDVYVLYFTIYSILGWITEMIYCRLLSGKFVDRGFLYGPYCPIYGVGAVIVILTLNPFANNILIVFHHLDFYRNLKGVQIDVLL